SAVSYTVVVSTTVGVWCSTTVVVVVSVAGFELEDGALDFDASAVTRTVSVTVVGISLVFARDALLASLSQARRSAHARAVRSRASSSNARVPARSREAAAASISSNVLANSTKASSEELNKL